MPHEPHVKVLLEVAADRIHVHRMQKEVARHKVGDHRLGHIVVDSGGDATPASAQFEAAEALQALAELPRGQRHALGDGREVEAARLVQRSGLTFGHLHGCHELLQVREVPEVLLGVDDAAHASAHQERGARAFVLRVRVWVRLRVLLVLDHRRRHQQQLVRRVPQRRAVAAVRAADAHARRAGRGRDGGRALVAVAASGSGRGSGHRLRRRVAELTRAQRREDLGRRAAELVALAREAAVEADAHAAPLRAALHHLVQRRRLLHRGEGLPRRRPPDSPACNPCKAGAESPLPQPNPRFGVRRRRVRVRLPRSLHLVAPPRRAGGRP
mmetsp:Transcript_38945/g.122006  ORF Transcript_38945/g.122006 Transcript_38945/m.122006 type:complete len:327 (-) Transcript_38945:95-1075(-)